MYENAQHIPSSITGPATIRCDINGVTSFVPLDPANTDYQNIMALVAAGELTIAPAE
jgi:hypothetical protein